MSLFVNHLEVNRHQLLNAVLHHSATTPVNVVSGQIWFHPTDHVIRIRRGAVDATVWAGNALVNDVSGALAIGAQSANGQSTIGVIVDGTTIQSIGNTLRVREDGLQNAHINSTAGIAWSKLAHSTQGFVVLGRSVTGVGAIHEMVAAPNTVLGRDGSGNLGFQALSSNMIANGSISLNKLVDTTLPNQVLGKMGTAGAVGQVRVWVTGDPIIRDNDTLISSKAIMDYVDLSVSGLGRFAGGFNASTATEFPGDINTRAGDWWYVNVEGTVLGTIFRVNDMIFAKFPNPTKTNPAHYTFVESNKDVATNATGGWVTIASLDQLYGNVTGAVAINPDVMTAYMQQQNLSRTQTQFVGNGVATQFDLVHTFFASEPIVQVYEAAGLRRQVYASVSIVNATTVRVAFGFAPAMNEYRVVMNGTFRA